tara:strand:+ start:134 stop:1018 length:885 start_codon:yes stop_codon:yes gene_type:complete
MRQFLLILLVSYTYSQSINNYYIRQDSVFIGDLINYVIKLDLLPNQFAVFSDIISDTESFSTGKKLIGENYVEYEITFWQTGEVIIPSIPIQIMENNKVKFTLNTDTLVTFVNSHIDQPNLSIRDIKGMRELEILSRFEKFLIYLLIFSSLIFSIIIWRKRQKSKKKKFQRIKYSKPIYLKTLDKLNDLEIQYPIDWGSTEKYYVQLTLIFRDYLAKEFYFKALEMTTDEILRFFKGKKLLEEQIENDMNELLNRADLSKYAKQIPDKDYFNKDKEKAIFLVKALNDKLKINKI